MKGARRRGTVAGVAGEGVDGDEEEEGEGGGGGRRREREGEKERERDALFNTFPSHCIYSTLCIHTLHPHYAYIFCSFH